MISHPKRRSRPRRPWRRPIRCRSEAFREPASVLGRRPRPFGDESGGQSDIM